jgi:hypothetical protein
MPSSSQPRPPLPGSPRRSAVLRLLLSVLAVVLAATACSSGTTKGEGGQEARKSGGDELSLKGVCPDTVVIQTNWFPQVDKAAPYHLLGKGYSIDAGKKKVTGPLVADGVDTGVKIEVRAGGPAIGFQPVSSLMYQDKSITIGMPEFDELITQSQAAPMVGVMASMDLSPQVIMWDPQQHPDWKTIVDIGQTTSTVLYFQGLPYMEYLTGSGILRKAQVDSSYDGTPSRFVSTGGKIAVQGYATNEPWAWQNGIKAWEKPLQYALITDTGYPNYAENFAVRTADKPKLDKCLKKLVPILQKAQVDFMADPAKTSDLIVTINDAYKSGFYYTRPLADYAVKTMRDKALVSNGNNKTIGDYDDARVQRMIQILTPIAAGQRKKLKDGIKPSDVVSNEYLDKKIGLPS